MIPVLILLVLLFLFLVVIIIALTFIGSLLLFVGFMTYRRSRSLRKAGFGRGRGGGRGGSSGLVGCRSVVAI
jgi:hypothetical protein